MQWPVNVSRADIALESSTMMKRFIGYHLLQGAGRIAPADAYYRTQGAMSLYTDQKTPLRRSFMLDLANDPEGGPLESLFHEL